MNFQEKYKIIRKLGTGATASVFLVEDRSVKKRRAVKIYELAKQRIHTECAAKGELCLKSKAERVFGSEQMTLIRNEIHILNRLCIPQISGERREPQVPEIIEVIEEYDRVYIVMNDIRGVTLHQHMKICGSVSAATGIRWLWELCDILERLHSMQPPIVFCDLKPENIMIREDGSLAVVDFGSACQLDERKDQCAAPAQSCKRCGGQMGNRNGEPACRTGTKGYAAPELYDENREVDARADIYSLGAVGKFILPEVRGVGVRKKLRKLLSKCMERESKDRYSSCKEIQNELMRIKYKKCKLDIEKM